MVSSRPSYPNPTVQQVTCDIWFQLPDGATWKRSWYGDFYQRIATEYPFFEPVEETYTLPTESRPVSAICYHDVDGGTELFLSDEKLTIVIMRDYPGWDRVSERIIHAWTNVTQVVQSLKVQSINLDYLNIIERTMEHETLSTWFVTNPYMPSRVMEVQNFRTHMGVQLSTSEKLDITVVNVLRPGSEHETGFMLRILRSTESEVAPDERTVLTSITRLHDDIWEVFRSIKGPKLEQLLQGEIL